MGGLGRSMALRANSSGRELLIYMCVFTASVNIVIHYSFHH